MIGFFALSPSSASGADAVLLAGLSAPGMPELLVILVIILIIFGPKQLPKIGRAIGSGLRELKDAANKMGGDDEETKETVRPKTPEDGPAVSIPPDQDKHESGSGDDPYPPPPR